MATTLEIYKLTQTLDKEDRTYIFHLFKNDEYPNKAVPFANILQEIRDARFTKGFVCSLCSSPSVIRNGKVKGRQRYLCKTCSKTFGDTSAF